MSITTDFKPCVAGAFGGGLSRALFFDGMVLSEADLMSEQAYWRRKRKLTNRALGEGVVWGLVTEWNEKARSFTICPGYGLSCCGDDLVVECPESVAEGSLIDTCSEDFRALMTDRFDKCGDDIRPDGPVPAALLLEYVECPEDPRQTFEDPCAQKARGNGCRFGAVRETVRLRIVPPPEEPAGPLDRFCRKLDDLRAELDKAGVAMPLPDFDLLRPESRFGMAIFDAQSISEGTSARAPWKAGAVTIASTSKAVMTPYQGRLFVEPPAGYVFTTLRVDGVDQSGAALSMGWVQAHTADEIGKGAHHSFEATVSPLFLPGPDLQLVFVLDTRSANNSTEIILTVKSVEKLDNRTDCARLLSGKWLEGGDPLCKARTLALALIYGVAVGKLGIARCGAGGDLTEAERRAREQIAWLLCWLGWRTLFGFDVADPRAGRVQACLHALFTEWCAGFAYRGPRCASTAHGIYLGGLEISPKGRIMCFDPWRYRRHVLTGPLLTHWGGQFGLPSIDRAAGWFANWICCIAGTRLDVDADAALADLVVVLGKGDLAMGPAFGAGGSLASFALGMQRSDDPARFAGRLLNALFSRSSESIFAASEIDVETLNGPQAALVFPATGSGRVSGFQTAAEAVRTEVRRMVASEVPPMARAPMQDYVANLAEMIPLKALKSDNDQTMLDLTAEAMEKAGIVTAADLVSSNPETVADAVRAVSVSEGGADDKVAVDRSVGLVYDRVLKMLGGAGEAIAAEARKRDAAEPFTRNDLSDAVGGVRDATTPFLKKGQTVTALRAVAAKTVAARG